MNWDSKKPLRLAKSLLRLQMTSLLLLLSKNGSAAPIMQVLLLLFQLNVIITYYIAQLSRKREMIFSVAKKICWNPIWTRNIPCGPVPVFFSLKWIIKALPTPDSLANRGVCQHLVAQYLEYIFCCISVIDYKTFFVCYVCLKLEEFWDVVSNYHRLVISFLAYFATAVFAVAPCSAAGLELYLFMLIVEVNRMRNSKCLQPWAQGSQTDC